MVSDENVNKVVYDRILADVPCSGDGTFRKNIDLWTKWNFAHACNLHGIQSRLANRAVELLKPGGRMVYSTCSMNPVENEAVVYNLLLKYKDQLELVDVKDHLPGLKSLPGLYSWNVMGKKGEMYNTAEEVAETDYKFLIRPYMFPADEETMKELHLERCIRVLPHQQDTGGFFIAVIQKKGDEEDLKTQSNKAKKRQRQQPPEADEKKQMKNPPAKRLKHVYEENPFQFMDEASPILNDWPKIKEFFDISDEFPTNQMMTRNKKGENVRNVYFVSKEIRDLAVNNGDRIKFINMGVPLFSKAEIKDSANIELRVCQESLDVALKYFRKRVVNIKDSADLVKILSESTPVVNELSDDLKEQIKTSCDNQNGSVIFTWKPNSEQAITFTAWLGKATLRPLIHLNTRAFFLSSIGIESSRIQEVVDKIKQEDHMNSEKSKEKNAQYQAKLKKAKGEEVEDEKEIEEDKDVDINAEAVQFKDLE